MGMGTGGQGAAACMADVHAHAKAQRPATPRNTPQATDLFQAVARLVEVAERHLVLNARFAVARRSGGGRARLTSSLRASGVADGPGQQTLAFAQPLCTSAAPAHGMEGLHSTMKLLLAAGIRAHATRQVWGGEGG